MHSFEPAMLDDQETFFMATSHPLTIVRRALAIALVAALLPLASVAHSSDDDNDRTRRELAVKLKGIFDTTRQRRVNVTGGNCAFTEVRRTPPDYRVTRLTKIPFRSLDLMRAAFVEGQEGSLFLEVKCGNDADCIEAKRFLPVEHDKSVDSYKLRVNERLLYKKYKNDRADVLRDLRRLIRLSRRRCGKG